MININNTREFIYNWASLRTNLPCIWLNNNAPRPKLPYITLHINILQKVGSDWESEPDINGLRYDLGRREFTLSIQHYSKNYDGFNVMSNLAASLDEYPTYIEFQKNKLAYIEILQLQDLTIPLDSREEYRTIFDVRMISSNQNNPVISKYEVGLIENIEFQAVIKDISGDIATDTIFNVGIEVE